MKTPLSLLILCISISIHAHAQKNYATLRKEVKARSALWNDSYNSRDSLTFYTLFDSLALLSSAGGRWIGAEDCKRLCRFLYRLRPDIHWTNTPDQIKINKQILVAYENGRWVENWTESGDLAKSELTGKYCIMWRFKKDNWRFISAIFTPLSCTGS